MTLLITGATGFIGNHLVKALCERKYNCRCLVRNLNKAQELFKNCEGIEFVIGDITNSVSLQNIERNADIVIHLAALLEDFRRVHTDIWNINFSGTVNLLKNLNKIRRFIFCSTPGVQGLGYKYAKEDFPYNARGIYEESKAEAEKIIIQICNQKGIEWCILRPDFVYGPGDLRRLPFYKMIAKRKVYIIGDGQSCISPTYVEDVVQAFVKCINSENATNNIFNISGNSITVEGYLTTIANTFATSLPKTRVPLFFSLAAASVSESIYDHILKKEPPITKRRIDFLTKNHSTDNQKAHVLLNFTPEYSLEKGLRKTIAWYKKEKLI